MELEFRELFPEDFMKGLLQEGKREDGRKPSQFRPASVNIGSISSVDGSAVVRIGGECVVCGVKMELSNPLAEHPDEGYVVCSVDLSYPTSPPSQQIQSSHSLSQMILEIILSSRFVEQQNLIIKKRKLCWVLRIELVCVSMDGGVLDAALLAVVTAIKNVKIPGVYVNDSGHAPEVDPSQLSSLPTGPIPFVSSFALNTNWGHLALLDPTGSELSLSLGRLAVAVTSMDQLCGVYKSGGAVVSSDDLKKCVDVAIKRGTALHELVTSIL